MTTEHDNTRKKWEKWAGEKKPSMKRRSKSHNYYERGIYMITMAIEGRRPILGTLTGNPDMTEGELAPHVVPSPLGEKVKECWLNIPKYYPQVEPLKLCIMPDHIHGILFVHERMEKHLGHVVEGFKIGTRIAAREQGLLPPSPASPSIPYTTAVPFTALLAQSTQQLTTQQHPSRHTATGRSHGVLWETGYNDSILQGKGQMERMNAYLDDNPRRLLIKRQHPKYFTRLGTINVAGIPMQAMGNRLLLNNPTKLQVQCSRHLYQNEIDNLKESFLQQGRKGAIIVSPCISPGEQQIATAALNAKIPIIVLLLKGIPPYFKPQPRYFEACANGCLLMLSPFPYQNERIENMRQRCLQLNDIAAQICRG